MSLIQYAILYLTDDCPIWCCVKRNSRKMVCNLLQSSLLFIIQSYAVRCKLCRWMSQNGRLLLGKELKSTWLLIFQQLERSCFLWSQRKIYSPLINGAWDRISSLACRLMKNNQFPSTPTHQQTNSSTHQMASTSTYKFINLLTQEPTNSLTRQLKKSPTWNPINSKLENASTSSTRYLTIS